MVVLCICVLKFASNGTELLGSGGNRQRFLTFKTHSEFSKMVPLNMRYLWGNKKCCVTNNKNDMYIGLTDDILHSILRRGCRELKFLDLSASPTLLTNFSVELIGTYQKKFCTLYLSLCLSCVIGNAIISFKAMYCPNLEQIDLSGVNATQTSFKQLSTSCQNLKVW